MGLVGVMSMTDADHAGVTLMLAAALSHSLIRNEHVLLTRWEGDECLMQTLLAPREKKWTDSFFSLDCADGLDSLMRLAESQMLSEQDVRNHVVSVVKGHLDWLSGCRIRQLSRVDRSALQRIVACMQGAYRYGYVAISGDPQHPLHEPLLRTVDTLLVCINQNKHELQLFFRRMRHVWHALPDRTVFVICNYDSAARFNAPAVKHSLELEHPLLTIPYSTAFQNACNERDVVAFFSRGLFSSYGNSDPSMRQFFGACKLLIETLFGKGRA